MSDPFRIIHLSDLHITARNDGSRYELAFPHKRLKGMNAAFTAILSHEAVQSADHIIITGDITDQGDTRAWKKFSNLLMKAGVADKTSFVIGNHDICDLGSVSFKFRREDWWRRAKQNKVNLKRRLTSIGRPYEYPWIRRLDKNIAIFGLDSNNAGSWSDASNALGEIGIDQLRRFARLLRDNAEIPIKIVALHHSPNLAEKAERVEHKSIFSKKYTRYTHEIPHWQRKSLRLMCMSHGVKRLIHGHMHEYDSRTLDGVRIIGAPSSTQPEQIDGVPYLRFLEYRINTRTKTVRQKWHELDISLSFEERSLWRWVSEKFSGA